MSSYSSHNIPLEELPSINHLICKLLRDNEITDVATLATTDLSSLIALNIESGYASQLLEEAYTLLKSNLFPRKTFIK